MTGQRIIKNRADLISALESGVQSGRLARSNPKICKISSVLRETWIRSRVRIVVSELCRMPLRIRASLSISTLSRGVAIPLAPTVDSDSFLLNRNFALSCSVHIQQQLAQNRWCGALEAQMMALAFQAGAKLCNCDSQSKPTCSEAFQS